MPKVSVIMPSYNKEKYIGKAMESIIRQTYSDWELIIIDDCSSDNSVKVIHSFQDKRIRFYENTCNIGIAENRNRGIELANGKYIALLDADDISLPRRLEKEVDYLEQHPEIDVVFGGFNEIDDQDMVRETYFSPLRNPKYIRANLMIMDVIPNSSCMYRKSFINQYKIRYRGGYLGMDDYLFWIECSLHGNISGIPDLFLYWRNTSDNGTNRYKYSPQYREIREKKYSEILKFALQENGFELNEKETELYCKILSEYKYKIINKNEILDWYHLVRKICRQAERRDNCWEIQKVFKKQFGICLENSYLWD